MELMIEHLSKRYGQQWALHQLSLRCESGLLGLMGRCLSLGDEQASHSDLTEQKRRNLLYEY